MFLRKNVAVLHFSNLIMFCVSIYRCRHTTSTLHSPTLSRLLKIVPDMNTAL